MCLFWQLRIFVPTQFWNLNISEWNKCDFKNSNRKSLTRPYVFDVVLPIFDFPNFCLRSCVFLGMQNVQKCESGISNGKSLTRPYVFDVVFRILYLSHLWMFIVFVIYVIVFCCVCFVCVVILAVYMFFLVCVCKGWWRIVVKDIGDDGDEDGDDVY